MRVRGIRYTGIRYTGRIRVYTGQIFCYLFSRIGTEGFDNKKFAPFFVFHPKRWTSENP